jgi:hypothetical protein
MGFNTELNSKPLHFLKNADRVFQKEIQSFLEHTPLPLYTFQFVKGTSENFLKQKAAFWWEHPSHFRSSWLVLNEGWQAVFINPKEPEKASTARIPLLRANVKQQGPFVLEVMLDQVERIVWVVDLLSAKGINYFDTVPFVERFQLAQKVVSACIQKNAVLQSCEVCLAPWLQIPEFKNYETNDKCHVAFIANEAGQRRHVLKPVFDTTKPITSNKPKTKTNTVTDLYSFIDEPIKNAVKPKEEMVQTVLTELMPSAPFDKKHTRALAYKDPKSNGPDLYLLELMDGTQIGSLALRSMPLRLELRRLIETKDKVPVSIVWYEPFQKYELKSIV